MKRKSLEPILPGSFEPCPFDVLYDYVQKAGQDPAEDTRSTLRGVPEWLPRVIERWQDGLSCENLWRCSKSHVLGGLVSLGLNFLRSRKDDGLEEFSEAARLVNEVEIDELGEQLAAVLLSPTCALDPRGAKPCPWHWRMPPSVEDDLGRQLSMWRLERKVGLLLVVAAGIAISPEGPATLPAYREACKTMVENFLKNCGDRASTLSFYLERRNVTRAPLKW